MCKHNYVQKILKIKTKIFKNMLVRKYKYHEVASKGLFMTAPNIN